ncbi:MAG: SDR family oxidoreductase [Candidatus Helarchaeales archaeon]
MNLGLENHVALVTGSSRGIGKAIALKFAEEGCKKLIMCARDEKTLMQAGDEIFQKSGVRPLTVVADLTKTSDIDNMANVIEKKHGGIDILVNNTGGPPPGTFQDFSLKEWEDAVTLNLFSVVYCCQKFIPYMMKKNWGRIINMTSISVKQPIDRLILSNTVRSGVVGLTKSLATELAPHGILVNSIAPGYTETERVKQIVENNARRDGISIEEARSRITSLIPLRRMARPEEIATVTAFLASEQASYVTGVTLQVDGGFIKGIY